MPHASDFRSGRHVVYVLTAHLVFVPKYRKSVISTKVFKVLKTSWARVCADFDCELRETGFEPDHVHLLVGYPPKVALARLVNSLKGVSARAVRVAASPEVCDRLRGGHFWSSSYCAVSCGVAPLGVVKRYIEQQRGRGFRPAPKDGGSAPKIR